MRSYTRNSPEAAARLLSLTALADGHVAPSELDALAQAGASLGRGLSAPEMQAVLHALCDDLLGTGLPGPHGVCRLDTQALGALFDEIDDPALRLHTLRSALQVAHADAQLHEAESQLLLDAMDHWGLLNEAPPQRGTAGTHVA